MFSSTTTRVRPEELGLTGFFIWYGTARLPFHGLSAPPALLKRRYRSLSEPYKRPYRYTLKTIRIVVSCITLAASETSNATKNWTKSAAVALDSR